MSLRGLTVIATLLFCSHWVAAAPRVWTLPDGRKLTATVTGIEGGHVLLLPENGKSPSRIPTSGLNESDRAEVDRWVPPGRRAAGTNTEVKRDAEGWPVSVVLKDLPTVTVVEENRPSSRYVYRSDHFEFTSTQRLSADIVREFSRVFEVNFEAVASMPLGITPEAPRGYFKVTLFPSIAAYTAAGAPAGSGGLFRGSTGEVMVPLPNLGVRRSGNRWIMDGRGDNQPLIHEVTHQVMGTWLSILPVWMVEGMAEYLAAGRCSNGRLTLHADFDQILEFLNTQKGVKGRSMDVRHPQRLLPMSHDKWAADLAGPSGLKNYASALLAFYFFCHADDSGTGIIAYFKARPASPTPDNDAAERDKFLLRGRDWDTLWKEMTAAFEQRRFRIS